MELQPNALYLLRGGHLVRYAGYPQGWGPEQVLRRLTVDDARALRVRYVALTVRRMVEEAGWVAEILQELGLRLPVLPPSLRP